MRYIQPLSTRSIARYSLALILVLLIACGAPAAPEPAPPAAPEQPAQPAQPAAPVAQPTPTPVPPAAAAPAGTINVGEAETGRFTGHPAIIVGGTVDVVNTAIGEGLFQIARDLSAQPFLLESWSISDDFLTWTFKLRQGVQFHKGYGEMTAEDVVYSYEQWPEGVHGRASFIRDFWSHPQGSVEILDDYTIAVNTGEPWVDVRAYEIMVTNGGTSTYIVSKRQSEEIGIEAANLDIAATGPWEILEFQTGQFWKMGAVRDHWRQTPHFAELVFWEIPEESSRVAGFQTGQLDTFDMAFDSIPLVEAVPGARLMELPNAVQMGLNLYGQLYVGVGTPEQHAAFNPDLPWVSASPDPNSPEWAQAVKVRQALAISIDRQAIVDTLLGGLGAPLVLRDWAGHEDRMPPDWGWDFDPDRARELLAEAGYPDGFRITLTPAIRGAPAEVEACEAAGQMWSDIGVDVRLQRIPYETLRPSLVGRTYDGATCHAVFIRLEPVMGLPNYLSSSTFSYGTFHPVLDEISAIALTEVDPVRRAELEREVYQFFYENALGFGLYTSSAVWPVGPRIEEWELVDFFDLRRMHGYENVRPRQ